MNNLKRVLSLGLVGTMLTGMMVIGAGAADFSDAEKITHDDAVNTLVALNVINGKPDGTFDPEGNVTRAEMAKMIAVAMNGGNDTSTGVKTNPTFTDIKGTWAESYIEYCSDMGIISGRGDGTFDPAANVTGLEATKMVLTALGYDAEAYKLTGETWAVRTGELARQADPNLWEELGTVAMATPASRDTAAQLIWNGLQNNTKQISPSQNTNNGEVTWNYGTGDMMLYERYGARVWTGTFVGNDDVIDDLDEGFIKIEDGELDRWTDSKGNAKTGDVDFAFDLDIANIGEEVKVVFKDGKGGKDLMPDKKDTIYGVFNTGKTEVYNITKNDLQDAGSSDKATKVKFGGSKYEAAKSTIEVVTNYDSSTKANVSVATFTDDQTNWRAQSADRIKFVCDENGKITRAYVVEMKVGRVTSVTASKVTVNGLGTVDIADNDVADGLAKDDIVIFTKFYASKIADAFVTITKPETVEGKVTGFKGTTPDYENLVVGGTTYKVANKTLTSVTADNAYVKAATGDEVRLYLCDGLVVAAEALSEAGGKYALVIDKSSGTVGSALDGLKLIVMTPDGEEHTVSVDKNSTQDNASEATKLDAETIKIGNLIEYSSINNGVIKVKTVLNKDNQSSISDISSTKSVAKNGVIWDKTAKSLTCGDKALVATASAPLFVIIDNNKDGKSEINANDDFYVYNMRELGDVKNNLDDAVDVFAYTDGGKVVAGAVQLKNKPSSNTADTLYGLVKSVEGTREAPNGDDLTLFKVVVAGEIIDVYTEQKLEKGMLVEFDQTSNDCYDNGVIDILVTGNDTPAEDWTLAAIVDNDTDLLTYYAGTENVGTKSNPVFEGDEKLTAAFAKDVTVVYVDADGYDVGDEVGYKVYDPANGYANALFHLDKSDSDTGVIDVIFIEISGEANLAVKAADKDAATDTFGVDEVEAIAVTSADVDKTTVELTSAGATATVTVSNIKPDNADSKTVTATSEDEEKVTVSVSGTTVTIKAADGIDKDANGTVKVTIKVGGDSGVSKEVTVTINIAG